MSLKVWDIPVWSIEKFRPALEYYVGKDFNPRLLCMAINQPDDPYDEIEPDDEPDPHGQVTPIERRGPWPDCHRDYLD
jgi:hypothetical protein